MLKTFAKGGVHPSDCKFSASRAIEILPIPVQAIVPMGQNLGAPSTAIVKKGDIVKVGQLIAESSGFISANIHSPVSGKVNIVGPAIDSSGTKKPAVIIDVEGDEWLENIDKSLDLISEIKLSSEEIIAKLKDCGIVGLGGATFPTHVKLMVPKGKKAEILVVNGVECEPYLTADHRLMLEKPQELLIGTQIMMKGLNVQRAIIGIENNKKDAIEKLTTAAKDFAGIEVQPLKVNYPQGGEKQLIQAILNKEVPDGGLPIDIGTVVSNVGTLFAIYEAVQKNKPLIDRIVTVTGKTVSNPCNLQVRIGTPISALLEKAGGLPEDCGKIINGGPMMGKALTGTEVPVVKGTSGILIMSKEEAARVTEHDCIRCGRCVQGCSLGAEPYLIAAASKYGKWELAEKNHVMSCCECGACSYTCPAGVPLLDYIRLGKMTVGNIIRNRK